MKTSQFRSVEKHPYYRLKKMNQPKTKKNKNYILQTITTIDKNLIRSTNMQREGTGTMFKYVP